MDEQETLHPSKVNILIVDDIRDNLRLLSGLLVAEGYTVRPVADGRLALSSAKAKPPDLILLDIMMPGLSGYEICAQLKTDPRTRDIPIIFISALNEVFDKVKAFTAGGVDYITKPFQSEEVLARVKTHLAFRYLQITLQAKNLQLQQEVAERQRAEDALKRHNWELDLLNQMNSSLQHCAREDQTYSIFITFCQQLFPADAGCLYLTAENQRYLEIVGFWGKKPRRPTLTKNSRRSPTGAFTRLSKRRERYIS